MDEREETWMDVKGFEGLYQVSDMGRVKSLARSVASGNAIHYVTERIMRHWRGVTSLYDCVRLYKNGNRKKYSVHRLVAQHFLPDWDAALEVNHIDGNRYNNVVSNLEMCTRKDNVRHSIIHFLKNDYGEKSTNARLSNAQAREIRKIYRTGTTTQEALALQYGVCRQTISAISRYKKYIR